MTSIALILKLVRVVFWQTALHNPPVAQQAQKFFAEQAVVHFSVIFQSADEWRCKAKLAVRGTAVQPLIGLYAAGTHDVVPIPQCVVQHSLINAAMIKITHKIRKHRLEPYDEQKQSGLLRYLQFMVCRAENSVQLTVVAHLKNEQEPSFQLLQVVLHELWQEEGTTFWHSMWVNFNTQTNNVIFGAQWKKIVGPTFLIEHLINQPFCFQPMVFAQANLALFEKILQEIISVVLPKQAIVEFYAGIGVIGLLLAQQAKSVICCESHPAAETLFDATCSLWQPSVTEKMHFHTSPVAEQLQLLQAASVAIVDPPRKGLDPVLLAALQVKTHGVRQLVYLSCGFQSLQRDLLQLLAAGWQIASASGYILFPGSDHIETLVILQR